MIAFNFDIQLTTPLAMAKSTEKRNKEKPKASSKSSKTSKRTTARKPKGNKSHKRSPSESGDSDTDSRPAVKKQKKSHRSIRSHGEPESETEVITADDKEQEDIVEVVDDGDKSNSADEVS